MMTIRECFKLAYGATRMAWNADTRIGWVGPQAIARAVEYASTDRCDLLARHLPGRVLRMQNDKRYYVANPMMRPSWLLNCRCVIIPIEVGDG
jgi:hypothetical protein